MPNEMQRQVGIRTECTEIPHLIPTQRVDKSSAGQIAIPLVRTKSSRKSAKGVHLAGRVLGHCCRGGQKREMIALRCGAIPGNLLDFRSLPAWARETRRTGPAKSNRTTTGRWCVSLSARMRGGVSRPCSPGRRESQPSFCASPCLGEPSP
jgi:hypothetical protein